jgi:predicted phage tail component-like protein
LTRLSNLYYKGINSLDLSLIIKSKGSYNTAERDLEFISVPGRNGDLVQDNGRYKNIVIPYDMALIKHDHRSFNDLCDAVKNWLSSDGRYYQLWDSYEPRYFRYATITGEIDIATSLAHYGELSLKFNCKPLRYAFEGQKVITAPAAGLTLHNPEIMTASPYIKIFGNGDITMTVNNTAISLYGVSEYIEIDSELMNVYKGTAPLNNSMSGDTFPTFAPGDNSISFTGSVTSAEIIPRWCTR